jgi:hypothetical protein
MSTLTKAYQNNLHPRMFMEQDQLDALSRFCQSGDASPEFKRLLVRCEEYCSPGSDRYLDEEQGRVGLLAPSGWGSTLGGKIGDLALAAVVTNDKRWLEKLSSVLAIVASGIPVIEQDAPFGAEYSNEPISISLGGIPFAYDLAYNMLDDGLKEQIESYLRERAIKPYRDNLLRGNKKRYIASLGVNPIWHELWQYCWAVAAVCDANNPDDIIALEEIADYVRIAIQKGVDEQGVIGEGPGYGGHDIYRWISVADILARAGICNLWEEESNFAKIAKHYAYILLPGRREMMNRCDANQSPKGHDWTSLLISAVRTGDSALKYVWEVYAGERIEHDDLGKGDVNIVRGAFEIVCRLQAENLASISPDEAGWSGQKEPGVYGVHISRTGWQEDDLYFSLYSAGRSNACWIHQHVDGGNFYLQALGESFSIEGGYGDIQGRQHSVMLPKGEEPPHSPEGFDMMWVGGHNLCHQYGRNADYMSVDISRMYDCYWYYRHALVVRAPGSEPYVILADDCNYRPDYYSFDWLMHTAPENKIEVDNSRQQATVQGKKNRMEMAWVMPSAEDYPKPHVLDLKVDMVDSAYFHKPTNTVLGVGTRPCLNAQLQGYNGVMMTAMMPRRAEEGVVGIERIYGVAQFGFKLNFGDYTDTVIFSSLPGRIDLEGIKAEAKLVMARRDKAGRLLWWSAAEANIVNVDGYEVLGRQSKIRTLAEA